MPVSELVVAPTLVEIQGVAMKESASFAPQSEAAAASSADVHGPGEEVVTEQHIHIPNNFVNRCLLFFQSIFFSHHTDLIIVICRAY